VLSSVAVVRRSLPGSVGVRQGLLAVVVALGLATVVGAIILWPSGPKPRTQAGKTAPLVNATVVRVSTGCGAAAKVTGSSCRDVEARVTSGSTKGAVAHFQTQGLGLGSLDFHRGDHLILSYDASAPPGLRYSFSDFSRTSPILLLVLVFAVLVVVVGRVQGVLALIGLGASVAVLAAFVLPALLRGTDPLSVALVGTSLIAFAAIYLAQGLNRHATVALLATVLCIGLTAVLGQAFIGAAHLTGLVDESAVYLQLSQGALDLRGLLVAGLIIGALGVLDDITVTQVEAVAEIHDVDPQLGRLELYRRARRIGRHHLASTVNTLVFAYAGAALPYFLIVSQSGLPTSRAVTSELVATEIIRTLVASIGLLAAVPLATALAAWSETSPARAASDPVEQGDEAEPSITKLGSHPTSWEDFSPKPTEF
jgi:uncharacterized membrane protein